MLWFNVDIEYLINCPKDFAFKKIYVSYSINGIHPRPRKVLQLFRLRQINNATFVRLNKATIHMLRIAEPYITMG